MTMRLGSGRYFGRSVARRSVCGLLMVETVYGPGDVLPLHHHARPYLLVMLDGQLVERALNRDNEFVRGTLVLNSAGEAHHDRVGRAGARCLNIELDPVWLSGGPGERPVERAAYTFAGESIGAVGRLERELGREGEPCALEVEDALHRLLDTVAGRMTVPARPAPPWVARVTEMLHEQRGESLSIRDIAAAVGVHPAHLCRTFAANRGCTIGDYVRRLRADRALHLILHTTAPLATVAAQAGFTDQSHLTRAVRQVYHTTPARLRREGRR